MSVSFFDLMKYARTGIASPEMTGFDKLRARAAFGGYPVSTITGTPPISFKADGKPLTSWTIAGNMVQTGTPTPDAPVTPQECGDLVESGEHAGQYAIPLSLSPTPIYLPEPLRRIGDYADEVSSDGAVTRRIKKLVLTGTETWADHASQANVFVLSGVMYYMEDVNASGICTHYPVQITAGAIGINDKRFAMYVNQNQPSVRSKYIKDTSFSTANELKAWLSQQNSAGTPVCVWYVLANATTETVTVPTIVPARGSNTLSIGTTLPPSEVSITGGIK